MIKRQKNIVTCGHGIATIRQASLIRWLEEELCPTYTGCTVKDASAYITKYQFVYDEYMAEVSALDAAYGIGQE